MDYVGGVGEIRFVCVWLYHLNTLEHLLEAVSLNGYVILHKTKDRKAKKIGNRNRSRVPSTTVFSPSVSLLYSTFSLSPYPPFWAIAPSTLSILHPISVSCTCGASGYRLPSCMSVMSLCMLNCLPLSLSLCAVKRSRFSRFSVSNFVQKHMPTNNLQESILPLTSLNWIRVGVHGQIYWGRSIACWQKGCLQGDFFWWRAINL